jgi:hypothetical protein
MIQFTLQPRLTYEVNSTSSHLYINVWPHALFINPFTTILKRFLFFHIHFNVFFLVKNHQTSLKFVSWRPLVSLDFKEKNKTFCLNLIMVVNSSITNLVAPFKIYHLLDQCLHVVNALDICLNGGPCTIFTFHMNQFSPLYTKFVWFFPKSIILHRFPFVVHFPTCERRSGTKKCFHSTLYLQL